MIGSTAAARGGGEAGRAPRPTGGREKEGQPLTGGAWSPTLDRHVAERWSQAEVLVSGGLCVLVQEAAAAKEEVLKLQKHIRAVLWQEEGKGHTATCPL